MASTRNALAALPRSLKLSPSTNITREHVLSLYKEQLRVAHSFSSYNFKSYFIRRTRDKFRNELPALLDGAYASTSTSQMHTADSVRSSTTTTASVTDSAASEDNSIYAPTSTPSASSDSQSTSATTTTSSSSGSLSSADSNERLRAWYAETLADLAVMARSAIVNQMYEAPKLVVEGRAKMMVTGGGGAGMEASYGGAGQPTDPPAAKNPPQSE